MYNKELEKQLHELFITLKQKSEDIISNSRTLQDATERIMRIVSSSVSAEAEGYVIDIYSCLVEKIKADDFFKNPDNLNAFYRLNLREDINNKYQFNIESIDAYKQGIDYKEVNQIFSTLVEEVKVIAKNAAIAAGGTMLLEMILKLLLSKFTTISIPFSVIIAGAFAAALVCGGIVAAKEKKNKNKKEYRKAVNKFLTDLETDILNWFVDIEVYFYEQVRSLYKLNVR